MLNERSESSREMGQGSSGSENQCYRNVRPTHLRDGRRNKSALFRRDISPSSVARFHSKYNVSEGCWLWTGSRFHYGHGQFVLERDASGHQSHQYAHRVAYVLAKGDIPHGLVVRHSCDTPACVNPDHLILGTQADNIADASRQGKYLRGLTRGSVRWVREQRRTGAWPKRGRPEAA